MNWIICLVMHLMRRSTLDQTSKILMRLLKMQFRGVAFLGGVIVMGSVVGLSAATTALTPVSAHAATSRFCFEAVSVSTKDAVVVPNGYNWHVATRWRDPLFSDIPEFDYTTCGTSAS